MKKCLLWLLILRAGFSLFAQTDLEDEKRSRPDIFIFFQPVTGVSINMNDNALVTRMIVNEINVRNYGLIETPHGADFILFGTLTPYDEDEEDEINNMYIMNETTALTTYSFNTSLYDPWSQLYLFQLILKDVETNENVLLQNLYYYSIDDIYNFFPVMMHNLFSHISGEPPGIEDVNEDWQNKWLYIRVSFDFPITFYLLQPDGLIAGTGMYDGTFDHPTNVSPLDNKVVALPGATVGFEWQFIDFMSVEAAFHANWEHLNDQDFFNMTASVSVKAPIKFRNIILEPYGSIAFPVWQFPFMGATSSKVFDSFPIITMGGGLQVGLKGGKSNAVFLDINYMYAWGEVGMNNPFTDHWPNPPVINYKRSAIGLAIGYKFGFFTRHKANDIKTAQQ